jgi:hypothetical protein
MKYSVCRARRLVASFRTVGAMLTLGLALVTAAPTAAQTTVFVPGNASGAFGNSVDLVVPLVPAITVTGPASITVTYISGTVDTGWCWDGVCLGPVGPNGARVKNVSGGQTPLQEAKGISGPTVDQLGALIGVFVPRCRVDDPRGFRAIDGTKNMTPVGIQPYFVHFIGTGGTFNVKEAGTLFLGINDWITSDNSGGFTVTVTGP